MEFLNSINLKSEYRTPEYHRTVLLINVVKWLVQKRKVTVFGGVIRDLILLEENIKKFKIDHPKEDFWNPTFGDFNERFTLTNNIDVAYYDKNIEDMMPKNFNKSKFLLSSIDKKQKENYYTEGTQVFTFKATEYLWKYFSDVEISCEINFLCFKDKPFLCKEDFECNMFCISHTSTYPYLFSKISDYIDSIAECEVWEYEAEIIKLLLQKKTRVIPLYSSSNRKENSEVFTTISSTRNVNLLMENLQSINTIGEINNKGEEQIKHRIVSRPRKNSHLLFSKYDYESQIHHEDGRINYIGKEIIRISPDDDQLGNNMNPSEVNMKIIRLERVIKMLMSGWDVVNVKSISQFHPIKGYKYGAGYNDDPYHGCGYSDCPHDKEIIKLEERFEEDLKQIPKRDKHIHLENIFF